MTARATAYDPLPSVDRSGPRRASMHPLCKSLPIRAIAAALRLMTTLGPAFAEAASLIARGDREPRLDRRAVAARQPVPRSLLASLVAFPVGAALAVTRFPGRQALIVLLNALLGLPAVVAGLAIYLLLSRAGPLGALGILFTPTAMVIAQALLVFPLIAALARQAVADAWRDYREQLQSLGATPMALGRSRCCTTCASRW